MTAPHGSNFIARQQSKPTTTMKERRLRQQQQCLLLSWALLWSCLAVARGGASMPTFFTAAEGRFDRYAACLAATEKLRRDYFGTDDGTAAPEEYAKQASHILNGLGSSLEEYNAIGREVLQDKDLKKRVRSAVR
jgi:hypothetical protein